ncbi:hypothetical protein LCGC14_0603160 [marine sediment metagenome]|uniref:PIN like domain-containing protein n=1 Tax=marine sediment metagenome TaxID=412755 RepID=A0A0F9TW27_9ZZZZ
MSKDKYILNGNKMLVDGCFLIDWYQSFKKKMTEFNNPLLNIPPEDMFKQEEDKDKLKLIRQKTEEIISIYKDLFETFKKSLSRKDIKNLW